MKLSKLVILLCLIYVGNVSSQIEFCGTFPLNQASTDDPTLIYFDRFGNSYDIPDPDDQQQSSTKISGTGFCDLIFPDDPLLTQEHIDVIIDVFDDVSMLIPSNNLDYECGDTPPIANPTVQFSLYSDSNSPTIAAASPNFYGIVVPGCETLIENSLMEKYLTGTSELELNAQISLNTAQFGKLFLGGANETWDANEVDFYSVIFHEVGHLLGFASSNLNTTIYDLLLTANGQPVHENTCNECYNQIIDLSPLLENGNGCNNGQPNVLANGIPVEGYPGVDPNDIPAYLNAVSHLSAECAGGSDDYVMNAILYPLDEKRNFTSDEIAMLCDMNIPINNCNEDEFIFLNNELLEYDLDVQGSGSDINCCSNIEAVCYGETITLSNQVLCNDFGENLTIVGGYVDAIYGTVQVIGNQLDFTANEVLTHIPPSFTNKAQVVYYVENNSNCLIYPALVEVLLVPCTECANADECADLLCVDEFNMVSGTNSSGIGASLGEGFNNLFYDFLGDSGTPNENSPDFCVDQGDNYIVLGGRNFDIESFGVPLHTPIPPNCSLNLSVNLSSSNENGGIQIFGSENPPCNLLEVQMNAFSYCGSTYNCENSDFVPICNEPDNEILATSIVNGASRCDFEPDDFQLQEFTWVNTSQSNINYIYFTAIPGNTVFSFTAISDVTGVLDCSFAQFESDVMCELVQFTSLNQNTNVSHEWDFGDTNTSKDVNPVHLYEEAGVYTVEHTVTDQCGNVSTETATISIICLGCPVENNAVVINANINNSIDFWITAGLLDPITSIGTEMVIIGDLQIDVDYTFENCNIMMEEGAAITQQPNINVSFFGSTIVGCSHMWKGINTSNGGFAFLGNTISDAEFAVNLNAGSNIIIWGNTFDKNLVGVYSAPANITKVVNGFGLTANTFTCSNDLLPFYQGQPLVYDFLSGSCIAPTISHSGIFINDVANLIIDGGIAPNTFSDMKNGIITVRSGTWINDNTFTNMRGQNGYFGWWEYLELFLFEMEGSAISVYNPIIATVTNNSIDDALRGINVDFVNGSQIEVSNNVINNIIGGCQADVNGIGIYLNNVSGSVGVNMEENRITDANFGISISNVLNPVSFNVINNTYTQGIQPPNTQKGISLNNVVCAINPGFVNDNTININTANFNFSGISVSSSNTLNVENNTINLDNIGDYYWSGGMKVFGSTLCHFRDNTIHGNPANSTPLKGIFSYNSIDNLYCCNDIGGTTDATFFAGENALTNLAQNSFNNLGYIGPGPVYKGVVLENANISPQVHRWNLWEEQVDIAEIIATFGDPFAISQNSLFITSGVPIVKPGTIIPSAIQDDWFLDLSGPQLMTCMNQPECQVPSYEFTPPNDPPPNFTIDDCTEIFSEYIAVANGEVLDIGFEDQFRWSAQYALRSKLTRAQYLLDSCLSLYDFYYSDPILTTYGDNEEAINNVRNITSIEQMAVQAASINILASTQVIIGEAPNNYPGFTLSGIPSAVLTQNNIINAEALSVSSTQQNIQSNAENEFLSLLSETGNLAEVHYFHPIEKQVREIKLDVLINGYGDIKPSAISSLRSIANLCPLEYGNSVFQAQALLESMDINDYLTNIDPCLSATPRKQEEEDGNPSFKVFPNPSTGKVHLSNIRPGNYTLSIFDAKGIEKSIDYIYIDREVYTIDTQLVSGIYFISLESENGQKFTEKVLILKE